jgi:hypothetical protein
VVGHLPALFDAGGAGGEGQFGGDTRRVVVDRDADAAHGLQDLDRERTDQQVRRLEGRPARRVKGVLLTVAHDAEAAVEDPEVRVQGGPDSEVELAIILVAVEPVPVVGVAITRRRLGDRL